MNGSHAPRWSVFISCAGADLWEALDLATAINDCGAKAILGETFSSSARDRDRGDIESRVLETLGAVDEILVLLTHTPGLLGSRSLWLAIGWASARGIPIIGLLHGMTREELSATRDFPTLINNSRLFDYLNRESYLGRLRQQLQSSKPRKSKRNPTKICDEVVYHVFLCHNSQDKKAVKDVGEKLKALGLNPWLDEWNLQPGRPWQRALERQIQSIRSAAVFVGPNGIGPWQDLEQEAFLREFVKRSCPVIPVILQDCKKRTPKLPLLLKGMAWVDFRKEEPNPLKQLYWGITGHKG